jgi:hypothetical protein
LNSFSNWEILFPVKLTILANNPYKMVMKRRVNDSGQENYGSNLFSREMFIYSWKSIETDQI